MRTESELKALLSTQEQHAVLLIVENEFAPKGNKRTFEDIAEEVGVTVRQLYNYRKDNPAFNEYKTLVANQMLLSKREVVDAQLMKLVEGTSNNGNGSIKAIELYYKLTGALKESITINSEQPRTQVKPEEVAANIEALRATLK
ncbi:phBC6A51 family helix-turn-helix protein [Rummeliibacillus pycnus]|uniref:phBC6A51 family helix-turn-helix protein n=1 Tax=Rummeliibacillus pycnus TaxID=101070 RepID=UPI000C99B6A5|nr:phBC6A51 family helix-turn-helix protein [Rummeliibacillus pycnus]